MAKKLTQFRWYGTGNENNSPSATLEDYANGSVFKRLS